MTDKIPDNKCLDIRRAGVLLQSEFGIKYTPATLRDFARRGVLPFFRVNPTNPRDPYLIRAGDIRRHIWEQQNRANNRAAAR